MPEKEITAIKMPKARLAPRYPKIAVIGNMKTSEAAVRLAAMGDVKLARELTQAVKKAGRDDVRFSLFRWPGKDKPDPIFKYTEHAFGYIPKASSSTVVDITDAGNIQAEQSLKGASIKITLDRLRVFSYPGGGTHTILFDFYAQHQTSTQGESQDLHFTQNYKVREGGGAGISGYPVFIGLRVGNEGVSFKCSTVNVNNEEDQKLLGFLGGDVFKKGVQLINASNPVLPIMTGFATGIIEAFGHRNDNVGVQDFHLGLDFSGIATRAQLREGSYVAVQVEDASAWDWTQWVFKPSNGQIVSRSALSKSVPLNYVVFSVSRTDAAPSGT